MADLDAFVQRCVDARVHRTATERVARLMADLVADRAALGQAVDRWRAANPGRITVHRGDALTVLSADRSQWDDVTGEERPFSIPMR